MASTQFDRNGKSISVESFEIGNGWRWSYQIDAGPIREGNDRPLRSEELALQEGIGEAKRAADQPPR